MVEAQKQEETGERQQHPADSHRENLARLQPEGVPPDQQNSSQQKDGDEKAVEEDRRGRQAPLIQRQSEEGIHPVGDGRKNSAERSAECFADFHLVCSAGFSAASSSAV